jgi:hypothetical protein
MSADEHNRRIAERCLRMATFCERGQAALSLRQIAADHLEMADGSDRAESWPDEVQTQSAIRPRRTKPKPGSMLQTASGKIKGAIQSTFANINRAIQSAIIVAGGILVGISGFVALMLAMAPPGTTKASAQQVECLYRQMVSLDWSRERSLDSLQRFWSADCPASHQRVLQSSDD